MFAKIFNGAPQRHWLPLVSLSFFASVPVFASDLEPRSYVHIPVGLSFLGVSYAHSTGDLSPAPSSPLKNASLTMDGVGIGASRTFALLGSSAKADLAVPHVCYNGEAEINGSPQSAKRCETGDPLLRLNWNFLGSPAQTPAEFQSLDRHWVVGSSLQVGAPLGTYHADHILNAGTHRWMVKPGLGTSYRVGSFQYEAIATASFFQDNTESLNQSTLSQDPLYAVQLHGIYLMNRGQWLALDANYFWGGQTERNGVPEDTRQDNSRLGLTFSTPLSKTQSLRLFANQGVMTRIGNDFTTVGLTWVYRVE